ncbi:VanZ family protein [Neobacillus sp. WH10]|uniref:VanZ family protein n=1 Tax=Neobacillus sp. WH10 TaxID=3047873 RepID=UPI0024C1501D|nr:VanZ family protein [Neobacillus sp. WH10]WHY80130.1 VanZ family protein [Neobacillus sp. WH10]
MILLNGSFIIFLGVICYIIGRGIFLGLKHKNKKIVYWLKEIFYFLFVLYLLMVISVTLFPLALWIDFHWENIKYGINLIPLVSIIKDIRSIGIAYDGDTVFMISLIVRNVGGNILLLMPLGFFVPILFRKNIKRTVILGFFISVSIEFIQFFELLAGGRGRTVDVDDILCNVIGACFGYLIFKLVDRFQIKFLQNLNPEKMNM